MTKEEFIKNLELCSKSSLIDMVVIQWEELKNIMEHVKPK